MSALQTVSAVMLGFYALVIIALVCYIGGSRVAASVAIVALAATLALCAPPAHAQTVVGMHLYSVHVPAETYQNNENLGLYVRTAGGWTAGAYRNTLRRTSVYGGYTFSYQRYSLTVGAISGYQRKWERVPTGPNGKCDNGTGFRWCDAQVGASRGAFTLLLAPSVALPVVWGATPRVSYVPGLAGSANVVHFSMEKSYE